MKKLIYLSIAITCLVSCQSKKNEISQKEDDLQQQLDNLKCGGSIDVSWISYNYLFERLSNSAKVSDRTVSFGGHEFNFMSDMAASGEYILTSDLKMSYVDYNLVITVMPAEGTTQTMHIRKICKGELKLKDNS